MVRVVRPLLIGAAQAWAAALLLGCGGDTATPIDAGAPDAQPDAAMPDAGPLPGPCEPGELLLANDSCSPAGVPPELCGPGFEPDGERGCTAILPPQPCPVGAMATPGETTCRPVAPCGSAPWEGIPVDGTTQYVDGAYGGGTSNGSSSQPWTIIQKGIDAAPPGGIVAVAAGSYVENLEITQQSVQLWGTCPDQVEIVGDSETLPVIYLQDAGTTELHQVAITGAGYGVEVHASVDVLIDRVWIHHTGGPGLHSTAYGPNASVDLQRSLIEWTVSSGAEIWAGADLRVADSVIRDCQSDEDGWGRGLSASNGIGDLNPSRLEVHRSVVERSRDAAIQAFGADLLVEDSLIRDTYPADDGLVGGSAIRVAPDIDNAVAPTFTLRRSTVERNLGCSVCVLEAQSTVELSTIVDTAPQALDGRLGYGLAIGRDGPGTAARPSVTIRQSAVRASHSTGVALAGVDLVVEGLLVQDTDPEETSGSLGRGLVVQVDLVTGVESVATISGTRVEGSHEVGLLVLGSEATLDSVAISTTAAHPSEGVHGRGLIAQLSQETLDPSRVTMRHSLIEDSTEAGLFVAGAEVIVEDSVVRRTRRRPADDFFGDGVVAVVLPSTEGTAPTSLRLERCWIGQNDRAGIASFGAPTIIGATQFDCNAIALNGENHAGASYAFSDLGSNLCGCEQEVTVCQVLSTGLSPPEPLGP
ncbi:MAG: hypothetical protein DRI90_05725 [Deltaproteobacteria bacterium]|nr:MAG: hypothetical protein DRI90_05725 [Deltaproteobacteria bacterium]